MNKWDCPTPPGFPTQCPFNDLAGSWRQVVSAGAGVSINLTQADTAVTAGPGACRNGALFGSQVGVGANVQGLGAGSTTQSVAHWIIGGPSIDPRFARPDGSDLNGEIAVCYGDQLVMEPNHAHLFRNKSAIVLQASFIKARTGESVSFEFSKR